MSLHEQASMVGWLHDEGFVSDVGALDLLTQAAGIDRGRAAGLLLLDAIDRADDWTPVTDWNGWKYL